MEIINSENFSRKEILSGYLNNLGYQKDGEKLNKSLITYEINNGGLGKFPFFIIIDTNHPDFCNKVPIFHKRMSCLSGIVKTIRDHDTSKNHFNRKFQDSDYTKIPMSEDIKQEGSLFIGNINWTGVEHLEKVLHHFGLPNFNFPEPSAMITPEAVFLFQLGYKVSQNKEKNNRLTGDKSYGDILTAHVEHAKIIEPTPKNENEIPFQWKIKVSINRENSSLYSDLLKKNIRKICNVIIRDCGSPAYREKKKKSSTKEDNKDTIFFRTNEEGIRAVAKMLNDVQYLISLPTGQ